MIVGPMGLSRVYASVGFDFNVKFNGTSVNAFRIVTPKRQVPPTILEMAGEYPSDDASRAQTSTLEKNMGLYAPWNAFDDQQNGREHGAGGGSAILRVEDGYCTILSRSVARKAAREDGVLLDIGCADKYKIYSSLRRRVLSTFVQLPSMNPSQRRRRLPHANQPTNSLPLSTAGVFTSLKYSTNAVGKEVVRCGYENLAQFSGDTGRRVSRCRISKVYASLLILACWLSVGFRMSGGDWWFTVFSYLANLTAEIPLDDLPILIRPCLPTLHVIPVEQLSITDRNVTLHSKCQSPRQGYLFPSKQVFVFDRPLSPVESYPKATSFSSFRVVLFPAYHHDTFGNPAFTVRDSEEDAYGIVDLFAWWRFIATGRFMALMSDF
ncbi:hypothetical protein ARMSODRAFT_1026728 [Armillaria solidipes]|uniref:Uncharacterized protein n=1 Tax=Armillaria solidipes TaxID=1076256 RepID=A0A2H3B6I6_9AGAR|nr:hypothetical protein ARMSODRAFT_1026728 [Armillaria solidipes]